MIVGLAGTNASGKGTVADILKKEGFAYWSLSDEIREEARERGVELVRENLINLANEIRTKQGDGAWAARVNKKINHEKVIIDSIRHPEEVKILKKNKDFYLIAVDAPIEIRFERAKKRSREHAEQTLEEFKKIEEEEKTNKKNKQQIIEAMKLADYTIDNKGTIEELKNKVKEILEKFD